MKEEAQRGLYAALAGNLLDGLQSCSAEVGSQHIDSLLAVIARGLWWALIRRRICVWT